MSTRIHKIFFYILLLGVYGAFFSVQSFFNFEGQSNARDIFRFASLSYTHSPGPDGAHAHVARTTPLYPSCSHNIRLNKRFHQEDMPPCPVLLPARPEQVLPPLVLGITRTAYLPTPTLLHKPLRGPPVLA